MLFPLLVLDEFSDSACRIMIALLKDGENFAKYRVLEIIGEAIDDDLAIAKFLSAEARKILTQSQQKEYILDYLEYLEKLR